MSRTTWRTAGGLALGHVVLVLAGISQQRSPRLGDDEAQVAAEYLDGDLAQIMAGGYIEALGFVLLLPVVVFLGRAVGRRSETGRWAAQTAVTAGVLYVGISLAPGLAAGAAALYAAQHGADLATVSAVNDVRNFAFFLSMLLLAAHAAGVAVAGLRDRALPAWLCWSGLAVAVVLVAAVPAAASGAVDVATLVWMIWFVALAGVMIGRRTSPGGGERPLPTSAVEPAAG